MNYSPVQRVAGFVRDLRRAGYRVGMGESVDALKLLQFGAMSNLSLVRNGLRSLACRDFRDRQRFDALFDRYWLPNAKPDEENEPTAAELVDPRLRRRQESAGTGLAHADTSDVGWDESLGVGAGRQRALARTDFKFLTDATGRREIEALAERLAYVLRKRAVRRRRIAKRGRRIHLRRTLRSSLTVGGLPVHRRYVVRKRLPPKLVVIQDISHSMAPYHSLYTRFIRGLLRVFRGAEAFGFHIELYRTTPWFREKSDTVLRERLEGLSFLWMGGTRIAHSLQQFLDQHARRTVDAKTVVVLLSDGFDTDDAEQLETGLRELRQRARQLIWLSPALESGGGESAHTEGALYDVVDAHLPARSLDELACAIETIAVRR